MLLKDIFAFSNGKSRKNLSSGTIPIYGSTGIIGYSSNSLYSGENTLIARVGANCGYLQFVSGEYWVTDNTLVAMASSLIIPKYGYYLLGTLKIENQRIGAAQPLITIGILNSIETKIHPISRQKHIVNTIGSVDDLIENYQNQINRIIKTVTCELHKYPLTCLFSDYSPIIIKSGIPMFDNEKIYLDTSCIEGINNIFNGETISYLKRPSRANMQPISNSVWFAKMKGSYKVLIITEGDKDLINETILSTGFFGIKAAKHLPLSFLSAIIMSDDFRIQRDLNSVGTTMAGVNNETFSKITVPLLSKEEIKLFDGKYSAYIQRLSTLRRKISKLKRIKTALLKKYF